MEQCLLVINKRFWVKGARSTIRRYLKECSSCKRKMAKGNDQIMAPLPSFRVTQPSRPFTNVAVDYAGPLEIKVGRGNKREKRYICVFSCLQTRAVHLEVASNLETDAFLRVFTRMIGRRGRPRLIISDNGTNFVGALRAMKDAVEGKYSVDVSKDNTGIIWIFNPPGTPHFNGVCEIMVKLTKKVLYHILKSAEITEEELNTAVVQAEGILNSRPICQNSSDPKDESALTPNSFLRVGDEHVELSLETKDASSLRKRWRRIRELMDHFWKRWRQEVVIAWRTRRRWRLEKVSLQRGELVWILDKRDALGKWKLGRVLRTFEGSDGKVRVVEVMIDRKRAMKSITKIAPLELQENVDPPGSNQGGEDVSE